MATFLHVFISPKPGVTTEQVEEKMSLAVDWFRYHPKVYILYTTSDEDKWYSRLQELIKPEGSLFISQLDVSKRNGWMTKSFWDWLKKERA